MAHKQVGNLNNLLGFCTQEAGVQYIIDSVISELSLDPDKRFIQVETGFFWLWWNEQDEDTREVARQLVREGRLEIAGGGWSMADEASTHYSSFVDNIGLGLNTLKDALGLKTEKKYTKHLFNKLVLQAHVLYPVWPGRLTPLGIPGKRPASLPRWGMTHSSLGE